MPSVTVLGAGFTGMTVAAELSKRGHKVKVIAQGRGKTPPFVQVGLSSRWHGSDDLLREELETIHRFLPLAHKKGTGVYIKSALQLSKKANHGWNARDIKDEKLRKWAAVTQRAMRMVATKVDAADIAEFAKAGYKTIDEDAIIIVDSQKYLGYLSNVVKWGGGMISLGATLTRADVDALAKRGRVVNCMSGQQAVRGAPGKYTTKLGEIAILRSSLWKGRSWGPFNYVLNDDDAHVFAMCLPDGSLMLSANVDAKVMHEEWVGGAVPAGQTLRASSDICKALFGRAGVGAKDLSQRWTSNIHSRAEGPMIAQHANGALVCTAKGGVGVATSWSSAQKVGDLLSKM